MVPYEYIVVTLLVFVMFTTAVSSMATLTVPSLVYADSQNLRSYGESVLETMLTTPGSPSDWGGVFGSTMTDNFGLAQSEQTPYTLDADKVIRLSNSNPTLIPYYDPSLPADAVRQLGLDQHHAGFRLTITPPLLIQENLTLSVVEYSYTHNMACDPVALWANGTGEDALLLGGAGGTFHGRIRSNGGLKVSGANNNFTGGTEYNTTIEISGEGNVFNPPPVQVLVEPVPIEFVLDDYKPGGRAAVAAQLQGKYFYYNDRDLKVSGSQQQLNGLYYVRSPYQVKITGSSPSGNYTIVAEERIDISGSGIQGTPFIDNLLMFSNYQGSRNAISMSGANSNLTGALYAPRGAMEHSGAGMNYANGGLIGNKVKLSGAGTYVVENTLDFDQYCSVVESYTSSRFDARVTVTDTLGRPVPFVKLRLAFAVYFDRTYGFNGSLLPDPEIMQILEVRDMSNSSISYNVFSIYREERSDDLGRATLSADIAAYLVAMGVDAETAEQASLDTALVATVGDATIGSIAVPFASYWNREGVDPVILSGGSSAGYLIRSGGQKMVILYDPTSEVGGVIEDFLSHVESMRGSPDFKIETVAVAPHSVSVSVILDADAIQGYNMTTYRGGELKAVDMPLLAYDAPLQSVMTFNSEEDPGNPGHLIFHDILVLVDPLIMMTTQLGSTAPIDYGGQPYAGVPTVELSRLVTVRSYSYVVKFWIWRQ